MSIPESNLPWWKQEVDLRQWGAVALVLTLLLFTGLAVDRLYFTSKTWEITIRGLVRLPSAEPLGTVEVDTYLLFPKTRRKGGEEGNFLFVAGKTTSTDFDAPTRLAIDWQDDGSFEARLWVRSRKAPNRFQLVFHRPGSHEFVTRVFPLKSSDPDSPRRFGVASEVLLRDISGPRPRQPRLPDRPALAADTAGTLPNRLTDEEFAQMIVELSEEGTAGSEPELFSQETVYRLPSLKECEPDQVYFGVGQDQNFSYIAVARPRLAFVCVGNRQMLLQHMLLKAVFEIAPAPSDFLRTLLCRNLAAPATTRPAAGPPEEGLYEANLAKIMGVLARYEACLPNQDKADVEKMFRAYVDKGPEILSRGKSARYLEEAGVYKLIRRMHMENRIVPLVGELSGSKAMRGVSHYLREHNSSVSMLFLPAGSGSTPQSDELYENFLDNFQELPRTPKSLYFSVSKQPQTLPLRSFLHNSDIERRPSSTNSVVDKSVETQVRAVMESTLRKINSLSLRDMKKSHARLQRLISKGKSAGLGDSPEIREAESLCLLLADMMKQKRQITGVVLNAPNKLDSQPTPQPQATEGPDDDAQPP